MENKEYQIDEVEIFSVSAFLNELNHHPIFSICVGWVGEKGFGEIRINYDTIGEKFHIDSELMSREFVKAVLCKMVDQAGIRGEPENEN